MCGIVGIISANHSQEKFVKSLNNIAHRGPDGFGIWTNDAKNVTFGHRRLSIIDLSDNGKQPMNWADRYVITFNGEIYNYLELKTELEQKGIKFRTQSDTEVLLALYAEYGPACLNKLNGMWAFAIYDKADNSVFLSRDRMGKKPLFYILDNEKFVFASEMKALYPFMKEISPNYEVIKQASVDCFSYESTEHCLIENIKRFPAASYAKFSSNKLIITEFWNVLNNLVEVPKNYSEQVLVFKELFIDACKIRMRSDVSIGTALSGGIDSSATISTMNYVSNNLNGKFSNDWQHAYVASFPGTSLDETREAKIVVDNININATYLNIDPLKDIEKIFYYTYLFEEMFISSPLPFIQLYQEVKKSGTAVTLDGHGSDELFGGYSFEISHKLNDDFPNIFEMIKTLETINCVKGLNEKASIADAYPFFKNSFKNTFKTSKKNISQLDYFNNHLYKTTFKTILPTLLRNYDRYSMINGVEIRMPFLDHRIVSFAFSIPSSSKIKNGFSKSIVRDSMKGLIPDEIRMNKKKIGFHSPFGDWIRGSIKEWILDEMGSSDFKTSPFINAKEVSKYINNLIFSKDATFVDGEVAWTKFMPYVWGKSLKYIK